MKICIINNLYKPYNRGGAETIAQLCAEGLESSGNEVFIITSKPILKKINFKKNNKIYYISSIFPYLNKTPFFLRVFWHILDTFDIGSYLKIKSLLKKEKPDVVITHNLKGIGFLIPRAIKSLRIKHIHTLHDIQLLHPSGLLMCGKEKKLTTFWARIYIKINKFLFKEVDKVISPSQWLLDEHTGYDFFQKAEKIVLPNPIQINKKKEIKQNKNNFKKIKLLYIGHLSKPKGVFFLLNAVKKISTQLELHLLGVNVEGKLINKIAKQSNNIFLYGFLERSGVYKMMVQSDLLIVPSLCYENSPTVIYEAAFLGLPVLASRIGGITELIHFLGGILFNPNSEKDFILKLKWAIKNPQSLSRIGIKSSDKIKEYSLENYINKLLALIKD